MPSTFGERMKHVAKACECSMKTLSKAIGASHSTLSNSIADKEGGMSMKYLKSLHELTRVDLNWLICGEGVANISVSMDAQKTLLAASMQPNVNETKKKPTRSHPPPRKVTASTKTR